MWRMYLVLFLTSAIVEVYTIKWLSLHNTIDMNWWTVESQCWQSKLRHGLTSSQLDLCKDNMYVMKHISNAASSAVATCQHIFSNSRWNCSSIFFGPEYTPDLTTGTREQAIVHAIGSAAVVWELAKACSQGSLLQCSCGELPARPPDGDFKWGGCGDNVRFALKFSRKFLFTKPLRKKKKKNTKQIREIRYPTITPSWAHSGVESNRMPPLRSYSVTPSSSSYFSRLVKKRKNKKTHQTKNRFKKNNVQSLHKVNKHNTRVGTRVVKEAEHVKCKCHGVSGSCNIKTCWRALPDFNEIGVRLFRRYSSGVEVKGVRIGSRLRLLPSSPVVTRYTKDDLIYITKSPDYCLPDQRHGSLGTHGRKCNISSEEEGGCDLMCCGRGAIPTRVFVSTRCQCRYHWCCYVSCATCSSWKTYYYCK